MTSNPFRHLTEWFESRNLRERVLVLITALVVLVALLWSFLIGPAVHDMSVTEQQIRGQSTQLDRMQAELDRLRGRRDLNPNAELEAKIERRQAQLASLDQRIREETSALTSPQEMVELLRRMLSSHDDLDLVRLRLLEPKAIRGDRESDAGDKAQDALLFAHDVELVVSGGYLDVLAYLKRLESLGASLGWQALDYEVIDYPDGRARLRIRTLGLDRAWLGV